MAGNYDNGCTTCTGNCDCTPAPTDPVDCPECPDTVCDCPEPCPALTAGTFINATITVNGTGCISSVVAGSRVVQQRPEPCTSTGTPQPPTNTNLTLSTQPCNLLSVDGAGGLFAGLVVNQAGQSINVTGCGTTTSPLVFSQTAQSSIQDIASTTLTVTNAGGTATINTNGATVSTGGYLIQNGLVKTWTQPITSVVGGSGITVASTAGSATVTYNPDTAIQNNRVIMGVSCGNTFIDPATGALPVNGTWQHALAAVYGTRVHITTSAPATLFNSAGTVAGTSPSTVTYATHDAALAALNSIYTFAGTGAC